MAEDIRCPTCASSVLRRVYDHAFAIEWKCANCVEPFFTPLLSIALIDSNGERRSRLVATIESAGVRTTNELEQLLPDLAVIVDLRRQQEHLAPLRFRRHVHGRDRRDANATTPCWPAISQCNVV